MKRCLYKGFWTALLIGYCPCAAATDAGAIDWQSWSADLFQRAQQERRFVLLDLEAVWCHWCHVMDETTYRSPEVVALIRSHYLPVRVDQDAYPDLAHRYEDYGWPATIVFATDGTEIVKRRGYLPPPLMQAMLKAIIEDPSPGPSVLPAVEVEPALYPQLTDAQRSYLQRKYRESYDILYGGWGNLHKFIDADNLEYAISSAAQGDGRSGAMAHQTLDAAQALIDPLWGGVYQYSDKLDWSAPHYETIMWFQAQGLRLYTLAYLLWHEPRYLKAAQLIYRYLVTYLRSPDGAFYTSMDADLNTEVTGKEYYTLGDTERRRLGLPKIDQHIYARENGWAIMALTLYYSATDDPEALSAAERAAHWILDHRSLGNGGFAHGERDPNGPYLGDTLAMGEALLALYAVTGERTWLTQAQQAVDYIVEHFRDPQEIGFIAAAFAGASIGVLTKPVKPIDDNLRVLRLSNLLFHYSGEQRYRDAALQAMRYLAAPAIVESPRLLTGLLIADRELASEPVHITIVGAKDDPEAQALFAHARHYPAFYKRLEWWDRREGSLPNPDVNYPELKQAAAFACANKSCSLPILTGERIAAAVDHMLSAR